MSGDHPLRSGIALAAQRLKQRAAGTPGPCPYENSRLLDAPRPWLTPDRLLKILRPTPGEQLLELGPGTGLYTLPVAQAVAPDGTVTAFDVQQAMLDELTRRADERCVINIRTRCGDGQELSFDDHTFDAAYLVTVLGEVPDQVAVLAEIRRVLKAGGRLVVGELSLLNPHFVRLKTVTRRATSAGFRLQERTGPPLGYYARFVTDP